MSTWGDTDSQSNFPKFAKTRVVRDTVQLSANAATNISTSNTTLFFADTSKLSVGMFVSGNNISVSSASVGFFGGNVTITQVNAANVKISAALTKNVVIGDTFTFGKEIAYATTEDQQYDNQTYLVDSARAANATFGVSNNNGVVVNNSVAHVGWNHVTQGVGFVAGVSVANVVSTLTYANTFLSFTGTNTTPANASLVVLNGNKVSVVLNSSGEGYTSIPTVSASGANNGGLVFTITPGGRLGRVQAECLVALSEPQPVNVNSGSPFFPG